MVGPTAVFEPSGFGEGAAASGLSCMARIIPAGGAGLQCLATVHRLYLKERHFKQRPAVATGSKFPNSQREVLDEAIAFAHSTDLSII